jgi:hypothetical protein
VVRCAPSRSFRLRAEGACYSIGVRPALFLAARVLTFATSPARNPDPELLTPAIAPAATLTTPFLKTWSCVDRGAVHTVRACTLEQIATADANGDFVAPPRVVTDALPDPAAEASAFYHAARARSFFEGLAGHALPNAVDVVAGLRMPEALRDGDTASRPDATLDPFPFSFYLRAGEIPAFDAVYGTTRGTVWLGRGQTRDLAYDGTVVAHEMTHAMLDGVLHARGFRLGPYGASAEPDALNEALADYFAAAMNELPAIGEWAAGEVSAGYRSLDTFVSCPRAIDGQAHDESLLFSGALWSARNAREPSARAAFDAAVYRAVTRTPARPDVGYADVADAIEGDAGVAVRVELARRMAGCPPIIALTAPLRGGFHAPGTTAFDADLAPGVLQLRVEITPGSTALHVELEAAGVAPPLFASPRSPFAPVVLASWDAELRWEGTRSNATTETPLTGDRLLRGDLPIPAGARVAYLQIANRGQSDGAYDYVTVTMTSEAPSTPPEPVYAAGSGCSTSSQRRSGPEGILLVLIALRSRAGAWRRRSWARSTTPSSNRFGR